MKNRIFLVFILIMSIFLVSCNKDNVNTVIDDEITNKQEEHQSDNGNIGDPGDSLDPQWWGIFTWEDYDMEITEYSEDGFWFEILDKSDGTIVVDGRAEIDPDNNLIANLLYGKINFNLSEDYEEIEFHAEGTEWAEFSGTYIIVSRDDPYGLGWEDYYEPQDEDGRGDIFEPEGSDPGDTGIPEWWGEFKGEEFSIGITNYDGNSFMFTIYNLRNGESILDGVAAIYSDNPLMAEYGEISFSLYEDYSGIDFFVSESSEWSHMRGQYLRIE